MKKTLIYYILFVYSLTVQAQITGDIIQPTNCTSTNGSINLMVKEGSPPYAFRWSNGASTADLANIKAGKYCVTVSDAFCCEASNCFDVEAIDKNAIIIQPNPCIEFGTATTVQASYPGNPTCSGCTFYRGNWTGGSNLGILPAGINQVRVTNPSGCEGNISFDVAMIGIGAINNSICNNGPSNGSIEFYIKGKSKYRYRVFKKWYSIIKEGTVNSFHDNAIVADNLAQGEYGIEIEDILNPTCPSRQLDFVINCCQSTGNVLIKLGTIKASEGTDKGEISLNMYSPDDYTYVWKKQGDSKTYLTKNITKLTKGEYCVTVTSKDGCNRSSKCFTIIGGCEDIKVNPTTIVPCGYKATLHEPGSLTLDPDPTFGPYTYKWSNGSTLNSLSPIINNDTYKVTITSSKNNCVVEYSKYIERKAPTLEHELIDVSGNNLCQPIYKCNGNIIPSISYNTTYPEYRDTPGGSECQKDLFCGGVKLKTIKESTDKAYVGSWARDWWFYKPDMVFSALSQYEAFFGDNPCGRLEYCPIDGRPIEFKTNWGGKVDHVFRGEGPGGNCIYTVLCHQVLLPAFRIKDILLPCILPKKTGIFGNGSPADPDDWGFPDGWDKCSLQDMDGDNILDTNDCCCPPLKKDLCCLGNPNSGKYDFDADGITDYTTTYDSQGAPIKTYTDLCIVGPPDVSIDFNCKDTNENLIDDNVDMELICSKKRPSVGRLVDNLEILSSQGTENYMVYGMTSDNAISYAKCYDTEDYRISNKYFAGENYFKIKQLKDSTYIVAKSFTQALVGQIPEISSNKGGFDVNVARYSKEGEILWSWSWGSPDHELIQGLDIDNQDNINVLIQVEKSLDIGPHKISSSDQSLALVKLNQDGQINTVKSIVTNNSENGIEAFSTITDDNQNILVAYQSALPAILDGISLSSEIYQGNNLLLSYLSPEGNPIWTRNIGVNTGVFHSVKLEKSEGNYLIMFNTTGNLVKSDLFPSGLTGFSHIIKLSASGSLLWSQSIASKALIAGFTVDEKENIFIGGEFENTISIGTESLTSRGDKDIFIAKFDKKGKFISAKREGGIGLDYLKDIKSNKHGKIVYVGNFYADSTNIEGEQIEGWGNDLPKDFLAIMDNSSITGGKSIIKTQISTSLNELNVDKIYPNPFNEQISVEITSNSSRKATITVIDILGREILKQIANLQKGTNSIIIDTSIIPVSSLYKVVVTDKENKSFSTSILKL